MTLVWTPSTGGKVVLKQQTHPAIVTDNLVLNLDAFDTAGYDGTNTITDLTGNKTNGTLTNGAHHTDGPFVGAGYVEFDGSGDRLSASSSDFSLDGDFTVEYWIQSQNNTGNSGYVLHFGGGNISYFGTKSGSYVLQANNNGEHFWTGVPTINTWVHLALVRSGSTVTLYEDGISLGNKTESQTFGNSTFVIADWDGQFPVTGYISNFRILKGTALYTSNFTPPTKPLTAITNTVLLTCQGNTIADASSSARTITANNDAVASLGYPESAFEFDGSNYDYILSAANPTLNWGTGDFTVEMWVNVSSSTTYGTLFSTEVNEQEEEEETFVITMNNSRQVSVTTYSTVLISASSSTAFSADTWTHIVVTRQGTTLTLYINKSSVGTATSSIDYVAGGFTAGALPRSLTNTNWTGKLSNIKVYKGKALAAAEVTQNYNALKWRYGL